MTLCIRPKIVKIISVEQRTEAGIEMREKKRDNCSNGD